MLYGMRINNFALIDYLDIEFGKGLNVLTGETGAGKSIILDAIDVALGGKANSRMIRSGKVKASIEANFDCNPTLEKWLNQQEIELFEDGTIVCSRELSLVKGNFRSRCRVNGIIVNRQLINQLRDRLLEITAQGQTAQLMNPILQRELLDIYGGKSLLKQRDLVNSAYEKTDKAKHILEERRQSEQQRLQRLDLIKYQLTELNPLNLNDPQELEQLEIERDRLAHTFELQKLSYQVYERLYQNEEEEKAAADLLGEVESLLTDMVNYDKELDSILEMVKGAINQIVEAAHQIYSYGGGLEADPERLAEIEYRIRTLKGVCRKYGPNLAQVITHYQGLQKELDELTDNGRSLEELEEEYNVCQKESIKLCTKLTELRQKAAQKLESQLTKELKPLAMDKVSFECRINPCSPNNYGADKIEYFFSPNQGENLQPLSETASGGEMSRFLLALKACFSQIETDGKTLIFDEIDAGVSGKVAQTIAQKLHQLSGKHQVLCVTHQPLVAAMADAHFRVEKQIIEESDLTNNQDNNSTDLRTVVRVKLLDNENHRRDELAELTGGHSAMDAIAFANSLLETAASLKDKKRI